ncbi:MAG: 2OG-Fe(II) oxygenase [Longimicrobiales bacterium]
MGVVLKTAPLVDLSNSVAERVSSIDWERVLQDLDAQGNAMIERLLLPNECRALAGLYPQDHIFRSRVVMERHGFGRGEYKYFSYPRPVVVPLRRGDTVVFAVHHRPILGSRGVYRVDLRHGVSRVRSGSRHTLGIIFTTQRKSDSYGPRRRAVN